ncbi:MAG: hypothetical protein QW228_09290 [Candidatus Aenigmatarchaeota archaeon]
MFGLKKLFGNKAEAVGVGLLITAIIGVAVLYGVSSLVPSVTQSIAEATGNLSQLGVGGTIGALVLPLLVGIAIGLGLAKLAGKVFGIDFGI